MSLASQSDWPHYSFRGMGTRIDLWVDAGQPEAQAAFNEAAGCFRDAEAVLSRFDPASELSRLNAQAGQWVSVSRLLWDVLALALDFARETGGMFDPTVLYALTAAGYDRSFTEIGSGGQTVGTQAPEQTGGWQAIKTRPEDRGVWLPPGVGLDFGGIAKGYTARWAARLISLWGPGLVDAGGDLMAGDAPRGLAGWPVTVLAPRVNGQASEVGLVTLSLCNNALATSGVDHRYWLVDGRPAHHIIDPRTRGPAATDALTVTVMASDSPTAEVWAKVALIEGVEAGMDLLERRRMAGLIVDQGRKVHINPMMRSRLPLQVNAGTV